MVERLKIAVEKARAERARSSQHRPDPVDPGQAMPEDPLLLGEIETPRIATEADAPDPASFAAAPAVPSADIELRRAAAWNALAPIDLSTRDLERSRIISHARTDPAHVAFDVLRTRMLGALARKGWTRVGITSPNAACGKTFV
ncbi:MAG: exopolysaccharide biosynthesis protein, partial [Planctomycetota bacterium]